MFFNPKQNSRRKAQCRDAMEAGERSSGGVAEG
jgi:hypothetical protein